MSKGAPGVRYAEVERETAETRVQVVLDFDGGTKRNISTRVAFFDRMLELMAFHGQFDLGITAECELDLDDLHLLEDVGVAFGKAIRDALRETEGISRHGASYTATDGALTRVVLEMNGRGMLAFEPPFRREKIGGISTQNLAEFFRAVAYHAGMTLHIDVLKGENDHNACESLFCGFGRALLEATNPFDRRAAAPSRNPID